VVQNQPGAGSLTMTNALYHTGPFDGTVMGASFNGMPTTPLLQPTGVRFDPVKLNWLGSTNRETQAMYVWHTAPAQVLEDTRSKEIVMGAQAPGSTQFDYPVLANKLFGFKFKVVTGYESTPKIHLAMESGEVDGTIANWSTLKAINTDWITEKKIRILVQWALQKSPELDDVPLFLDVAKTEGERAALRLMLARAWNTAVRSFCRRTCRRRASRRCGARSMPRRRTRPISPKPTSSRSTWSRSRASRSRRWSSRSRARPPTPSPASARRWRPGERRLARTACESCGRPKRTPVHPTFGYNRAPHIKPLPEFGTRDGFTDR